MKLYTKSLKLLIVFLVSVLFCHSISADSLNYDVFSHGINGSHIDNIEEKRSIHSFVRKSIPKIKGRKPINSRYANNKHPNTYVKFKDNGFPDFSPYSILTYKIPNLKGNSLDNAICWKLARDTFKTLKNVDQFIARLKNNYVWHHVEDGYTMQLIPKLIHATTRHTGGASVIKNGITYYW